MGVDSGPNMAKPRKRSETASTQQSVTPNDVESTRDRIAMRAYELYLARGAADGGDFDDWLAAERELIGSNAQHGSDRGE
jgi:hypothetical protein